MSPDTTYQKRLDLISKATRCEKVERIPLIWMGTAPAPIQMGLSMKEFVYEPLKGIQSQLDYMDRLGVDGCNNTIWFRPDVGLSALWWSRVKMPGRDLAENVVWQVDEKEMMSVSDYDFILNHGVDAFMQQFLPGVVDIEQFMEGAQQMGEFSPIMHKQLIERGYPAMAGGITTIPFETLCGGRSMTPFFMDLYRMPDKLQEVMDLMLPMYIQLATNAVLESGIRGTWIGGWRTASALLAPKLWDRFVFPYFKQIVEALAEQDIISILHLDQNWTRDLARFLELPAKSCVLNLDGMTDIRAAKKILGDHMSILGDVPSELLATSTPEKVREYVKSLIEDVGPTGFLLCPGCDAPINAKHENLMAMYDSGREFGSVS
jgi:hypothetical protein